MGKISFTAIFLIFQFFSIATVFAKDRHVSEVEQKCITDSECIPFPECHPESCINQRFKAKFEKPAICTEIYMMEAAYEKEDCICLKNRCHNRKKREVSEEQQNK